MSLFGPACIVTYVSGARSVTPVREVTCSRIPGTVEELTGCETFPAGGC